MFKKNGFLVLLTFSLSLFISAQSQGIILQEHSSEKEVWKFFSGGSGTASDPYQITTCQQLQNMSQDLYGNYVLMNNVDCSDTKNWNEGEGFEPIGSDDQNSFKGTFNGRGFVIDSLYIDRPTTDRVGLFGDVNNEDSYIVSVGVTNANITGNNGSAVLIGWNVNGKVSDVFATGFVKGYGSATGGLIGQNTSSVISMAYSEVQVSGVGYVGGLVGSSYGTILNSYASGSVSGASYVGGFIGSNWAKIEDCYSVGKVDASYGGFAGYNGPNASITNSYWDTQASGQTKSAGGIGKTTSQMEQQETFLNWDFSNVWQINDGHGYPELQHKLLVRFITVLSPQKVNAPFNVILVADNGFSGEVELYSKRGKIYPIYINLTSGFWSGDVTLYDVGKNTRLYLRWYDNEQKEELVNSSNIFDVNDESGSMPKSASLKGRVTDIDDNPVARVVLRIYNDEGGAEILGSAITDDNGNYSFTDLFPGDFYLKIQVAGYQDYVGEIELADNREITEDIILGSCCKYTGKTPILFVPGIMGSRKTKNKDIYPQLPKISPAWDSGKLKILDPYGKVGFKKLRKLLNRKGYWDGCNLFMVPYDWSLSIPQIRDQYLIPWIEEAKRRTGSPQVSIVAHSMGGLVVRSYIQSKDLYNNDIRRFAMVGTPNKGSDNVYDVWEGGDPKASDERAGQKSLWPIIARYFYSNTLARLMVKRIGKSPCSFAVFGYTPLKCRPNRTYKFLHEQAVSSGHLMPTYNFALQNAKNGTFLPIVKEENTILKALNGVDCFDPQGCIDPKGRPYSFIKPDEIMTRNSTGVYTKLFAGINTKTVASIEVSPQSATKKLYKDGKPIKKDPVWMDDYGDGVVLLNSVSLSEYYFLPDTAPVIIRGSSEHSTVVRDFKAEITKFIVEDDYSYVDAEVMQEDSESSQLVINVYGRVQPQLASAISERGNFLEGQIDDNEELNLDSASIAIDNPVNGTYTFKLDSNFNEDYEMSIFYYDAENDKLTTRRALGYYDNSLNAIIISLNTTIPDDPIVFDRAFYTPINVQEQNVNNKIQLTWQDTTSHDIEYYAIYWKQDNDPYYHFLANSVGNDYLTDHDWSEVETNAYTVKAVLKNGSSTFLSEPTFYCDDDCS